MNEVDLLTEALNRTDPAERATFLDQACAGNSELRRRLEELLAAHAHSKSPLDRPPVAPAGSTATADLPAPEATGEHRPDGATQTFARPETDATTARESASPAPRTASAPTSEGIGTVIAGRYTLVEVIGEGGMGSVYLASQTEPVKRKVALKLIKTGMDSRAVLGRFDAERQALALMDHPNIARIYDGGLTPAGQPFFVMELVQGVPLTEYCDRQRLTVKARLELFVAVCQAVQHAHQKGIIHRDLKPGNVLVTEVDGRPTPKVIDFGVAKATEVKLTDMSLADVGAIVGTPAYMSPEQADPSLVDIDTRTDVYALGVMLYELLAGSPPLDTRQFQRGAILEMLRMVREVDPPRPSTKLSTAENLPNIAANRSIEPARLAKLLRGELDWVVMKALEKDRSRRYESANGLARDIQRFLADEVVEARPPSAGYRLKKFVRRNPLQLALAATIVLLLLSGGTFAWWQDRQSTERKAEARNTEQQANQGVDAALKLVPDLRKQYKFEAAKKTLEQAAVLAKGAAPDRLAEVQQALQDIAFVEQLDDIRYRKWLWITEAGGKGKFNSKIAAPAYRQAFAERDLDLTTLDPAASARRIAASAVKTELVAAVDDWALHEPERGLRDRLLDVARRADSGPWTDRLRDPAVRSDKDAVKKLETDADLTSTSSATLGVLAELMKRRGLDPIPRLTAARTRYPSDFELAFLLGLERFRSKDGQGIGPFEAARALRPENYAVWVNLGDALDIRGQSDEAIDCLKKAIELNPKLAVAYSDLGGILNAQKKDYDGAIVCLRKAIELDPTSVGAHYNLGESLRFKRQWDDAIAEDKKARELDPTLAAIPASLGKALGGKGQWDEAIASYREALELDTNDAVVHYNLGVALQHKGQSDEAIASYRKAIELDPKDAKPLTNLGGLLFAKGQTDEAIDCFKKAIALDPKNAPARNNLGNALNGKGKLDEAIECYKKAIALDPRDAVARTNLGDALNGKGEFDEAIECYKKAIALDPMYAEAHCNLGSALATQGRFAESLEALKRGHELGTKRPNWRFPSADWVRRAEADAAMEAKLPEFLSGQLQPRDNQERIGLAGICAAKKLHRTVAGLYAEAFVADSKLAADLAAGHRDNAICNAFLAAVGQGEDAAQLDDSERARLRHQGLDWLRADLALWTKLLESGPPASRRAIAEKMNHWKQDPHLASVRDAAALAKLTADEQKAFAQMWADVEALWKKAAANARVALPEKAPANAQVALPEKAAEDAEADLLAAKSKEAEKHLRAGKPELAVPLLVEILDGRKARLGPDHAVTIVAMSQLGVTYWRLRQFDKSVPLFEELLKLREAKHGRDHPETLWAVANLGVNYKDAGRLKEAIPLLEEAHQAVKRFPMLQGYASALIDAYTKAGENAKLAELLHEQLPQARKALPKDSPQLAGMLAQVGLNLLRQKKWTEAEPLVRECLAIREQKEPDDWRTFNTKSVLGGALLGQKKFAEAEPLLQKGYEGMKAREQTIPPQASTRIPEALDRLIDFYTATNKPDEVTKWQAERAKYPGAGPAENK
jgi:predicted ribosomally synthesized peptide with SipW-like signal peptide